MTLSRTALQSLKRSTIDHVTFLRVDFLVLAYPFADLGAAGAQEIGLNEPQDSVERLVPLFMRVQQLLQI